MALVACAGSSNDVHMQIVLDGTHRSELWLFFFRVSWMCRWARRASNLN